MMQFDDFYESLYGYPPFPWQTRLAQLFAEGSPPDAIAAPTASGKTGVIDAWVWALAHFPDQVSRRLWYVVQRRILVDDAHARSVRISDKLPESMRSRLGQLSATDESLAVLRLRGGVFEEMSAFDPSAPMIVCSTADQHLSRLLFRGYGVSNNSLPLHAALAGARATVVIDESHIIPSYEANLRRCASLGADLRVVSMTATPESPASTTLALGDDDRTNPVLAQRLTCRKPATLIKGKSGNLVKQARSMLKAGCRSVVVFCNTATTAAEVARSIPKAWLLTGRIREFDRRRMSQALEPLRSGGPRPEKPTVVVATQTLEVGADLDFDGLVTECASLAALRQRFGRLNRLGQHEDIQAAIVWDGKKQTPVYGNTPGHVYMWLRAMGDAPDMSAHAIELALEESPPTEPLDVAPELGPAVSNDLLQTWQQTNARPLWDPPVAPYIDPGEDITVTLVWRDELLDPEMVEGYPPHPQEAAPVPISAVRKWAGDRTGIRWRGPQTATLCSADDLRPGDVWILSVSEDDGRLDLGCVLADSPGDVADVPEERTRAAGELLEAIEEGEPVARIAELSKIDSPVVTPRLNGYVVTQRERGRSLSTGSEPIGLAEHCQAVSNLAAAMAQRLDADQELLRAAGTLHDIGKADRRMQAWFGAAQGELLAKSGQPYSALRHLRPDDLPRGWRHESLSARMLPADASAMVMHLIASHHGRCRPSLPAHGEDGHARVDLGGIQLESIPEERSQLEVATISRFSGMENPWHTALLESILVMADRIASRDELTATPESVRLPTQTASHRFDEFQAEALIGTTLLGWLAAVGTLRVLSEERPTQLHWNEADRAIFGGWTLNGAIDYLSERLKVLPPLSRPKTMEEFVAMEVWGPAVGRWTQKGFRQSPLMGTGAAHTGFDKAWPKLAKAMTPTKVEQALVGPWQYYDGLGQRWDSAEHSEHGSQWGDPSKEGSTSVHGANRLAIEALPLLPSLDDRLTVGWDNEQRVVTWPLWRGPLDVAGVRVTVRQPMTERWMSRKISVGQLASFLPAEPYERRSDYEIPANARIS